MEQNKGGIMSRPLNRRSDTGKVTKPGAIVVIPVVPSMQRNRLGNLCVWRLFYLFEAATWALSYMPDHSYIRRLYDQGYYVFTISHQMQITRHFREMIKRTDNFNTEYREEVKHIGKTSYSAVRSLIDQTSGQILATTDSAAVVVDGTTRRPALIPGWLRQSFRSDMPTSPLRPRAALPGKPKKCFRYDLVVAPSETDMNYHVFQGVYVRYAMDAASRAASAGFYSLLTGDMCRYDVSSQRIAYLGEARDGESVHVLTWEDAENPKILHFVICNVDGKTLVSMSASFLQTVSTAKL